jgi:ribosomal protein S12 methylthiotransferase accessory factor
MLSTRTYAANFALTLLRERLSDDIPADWTLDVDFVGGRVANVPGFRDDISRGADSTGGCLVVRVEVGTIHLACFSSNQPHEVDLPCPECFDRRCISWLTPNAQWAIQRGHGVLSGRERTLLTPMTLEQALLLARRLMEADSPSVGTVYSLNLLTDEVQVAECLPDAFCSCAARDEGAEPPPLALRESLVALPGDIRMKRLADLDLPMSALMNPVCGAVGRSHIPGFAQSVTAPIFGLYWQRAAASKPRSVGWSGLCLRRDDSERVGMIEALERQGGMQPTAKPAATLATFREVGERGMDPTLCFAYNEESYTRSLGLTRFDPDVPCNWLWGHSLDRGRPVLVPSALAFYHRPGATEVVKLVDNNSSGCALGSCFEEALLKSLFELIERDSFVLMWLRKLTLPKIDPASVPDERVARIISKIDSLGIDISLLNARMDIDLPAIIAIARRRDGKMGTLAVGASAHISPVEAISSALLEAVTSITELPTLIRRGEAKLRELAEDPYLVQAVMDHQTLYGLPEMAAQIEWIDSSTDIRGIAEAYPDYQPDAPIDISAEIAKLRHKLAQVGVPDVVVVDMTTREQRLLGLCTVRAIAPGLAPIDFGHPRNRAESLPRLWSAPEAAGYAADRSVPINSMAHPFP